MNSCPISQTCISLLFYIQDYLFYFKALLFLDSAIFRLLLPNTDVVLYLERDVGITFYANFGVSQINSFPEGLIYHLAVYLSPSCSSDYRDLSL